MTFVACRGHTSRDDANWTLVAAGDGSPAGVETGIRFTTGDADADHAHLAALGVDADPEVIRMGPSVPPMFRFRDPDGNQLVIVEVPSTFNI